MPATPAEVDHYGRLARLPNEPRRQVFELLDRHGPATLEDLLARWGEHHPEELSRRGALHSRRLITSTLWKLDALGWVADTNGLLALTADGQHAGRRESLNEG